jgi:hypothetical protein
MRKLALLSPLTLFALACSGGMSGAPAPEPAPPPLDPTGVYDCWLDVEGMELNAVLSISGEPGAYTGTVDSEMGPAPVSNITVDGDNMTFVVDTPDMSVFFSVVFDGDTFSGDFDAGGMGGYINGKKR